MLVFYQIPYKHIINSSKVLERIQICYWRQTFEHTGMIGIKKKKF